MDHSVFDPLTDYQRIYSYKENGITLSSWYTLDKASLNKMHQTLLFIKQCFQEKAKANFEQSFFSDEISLKHSLTLLNIFRLKSFEMNFEEELEISNIVCVNNFASPSGILN